MSDLVRRQQATEATLAKYRFRSIDWKRASTCVHMARFHMRAMGHRPPPLPQIRSENGACRALKLRGWRNVADMLDTLLPRIAPARMLIGDLAVAGSADGLGSIFVCAGPHKLLGWREDADTMVVLDVTLDELDASWRL